MPTSTLRSGKLHFLSSSRAHQKRLNFQMSYTRCTIYARFLSKASSVLCSCAMGTCARSAQWQHAHHLMQTIQKHTLEFNATRSQCLANPPFAMACFWEALLTSAAMDAFSRASRPMEVCTCCLLLVSYRHTNFSVPRQAVTVLEKLASSSGLRTERARGVLVKRILAGGM